MSAASACPGIVARHVLHTAQAAWLGYRRRKAYRAGRSPTEAAFAVPTELEKFHRHGLRERVRPGSRVRKRVRTGSADDD